MIRACIYLRVSSTKQARGGESLERQEDICRSFATEQGYAEGEVEIFREAWSGQTQNRAVFQKLLGFIEKTPSVELVVIRAIDRLTRGGVGEYEEIRREINARNVRLLDAGRTIQGQVNSLADRGISFSKWSVVSSSEMGEMFQAAAAKQELNTFLTRAIGQEHRNAEGGYWQRKPPYGFANKKVIDGEGKRRNVLVPFDPEAGYVRKMFELVAEGVAPGEVCRRVNAMGYRSRPIHRRAEDGSVRAKEGEKELTTAEMWSKLKASIYAGVIYEEWGDEKKPVGPLRAKFDGLISIDLWNRANQGRRRIVESPDGSVRIEEGPRQPRVAQRQNYPFRRVVRCPECGEAFHASASTGKSGKKYPAYHCSGRKNSKHKVFRVSREEFHRTIEEALGRLRFRPEFHAVFEKVLMDVWQKRKVQKSDESIAAGENVTELRKEQNTIAKSYATATSEVMKRTLQDQIDELEERIREASKVRNQKELSEEQVAEFLRFAKFILEHPGQLVASDVPQREIERNWRNFFSELPTYEQLKTGTPQTSLVFELCAPSEAAENLWQAH